MPLPSFEMRTFLPRFGFALIALSSLACSPKETNGSRPLRNQSGITKEKGDPPSSDSLPSEVSTSPNVGQAPDLINPGPGFSLIVSEGLFASLFPMRNSYYSYADLKAAADADSRFAKEGDPQARRREVAAFLANADHETTGLVYVEELAKNDYCKPSSAAPCAPGKKYYGRGPMQLSWNFNYANAAKYLGVPLLEDPDLISRDSKIGWQVMLWYWTTQKGPATTSSHDAIVKGASFGGTIRAINGVLECHGKEKAKVASRINSYKRIAALLEVDPGQDLDCLGYE